ncbi:NADH-quinone oxidoreductase subunit G [Pseudodesulfovibrio hydrargyri]|uniref:NADH-quinone oxidoreductase n=1 Tax=Pseudodesulfovibrio hydrargyri TaxID=2125990 RepID=A0A1J5N2T3_9BACT|nr:NADH-quinone oxidoreductase subunit NuoG [Pseudodesulfovibrio hydrargyri]OIQ49120.1 NADH-quinone oxidoreductase subunit G [Pseudodesulfovibrio hydrargyri]
MPRLTIDGRAVEVPAGTKVIDAAEQLGIMIPRFCYLKSLGAVGACRMCAVKFLEGHKKDLDMSCMVDARDGMVVSTDHPDAVAFRAQVIEWLMLDHPHDCPICDEGGHCLLQDTTVSGGHSLRNYRGPKRTYENQYLGPLIEHEMNRCIHCYRCVRFYREYAGGTDFGTFGIAGRVTYQRFEPGRLESPFSGNLGEICPTGTLTDKPSRYRARRWDLERKPSVCTHCSLGCNTLAAVRYREVLRVENRLNEAINGDFLCDRGRYGFGYASMPERPRTALVDGRSVSPEEGTGAAMDRLKAIIAAHGPESVAVHASSRCTLEDLFAAKRLADGLGVPAPSFFLTEDERLACLNVAASLDADLAWNLEQVRKADMVLVLGADPLSEAPMAALAVRQAARSGATVAVLDPRPVDLPCEPIKLPVRRGLLPVVLAKLLGRAFIEADFQGEALAFWRELQSITEGRAEDFSELSAELDEVAHALARAERPVVVCSATAMPAQWPVLAAGVARLLRRKGGDDRVEVRSGLFCLLPRADSLGAALLAGGDGASLEGRLMPGGDGRGVKAFVCIGADPLGEYPGVQAMEEAVGKLDLLVCVDCAPSATWSKAQVALPMNTIFETGGCLVDNHGSLQRAEPVFAGGLPVIQDGHGSHPPRTPGAGIPGNDPRGATGWIDLLAPDAEGHTAPSAAEERLRTAMAEATAERGVPVLPSEAPVRFGSLDWLAPFVTAGQEEGRCDVLVTGSTFGADRLANLGEPGETLLPDPRVLMHPLDAAAMRFEEGQTILIPLAQGVARTVLRRREDMARNTVVLPRTPGSGWRFAGGMAATISMNRLWREQGDEDRAAMARADTDDSCPGGNL